MRDLRPHDLAASFPPLPDAEFAALKADILARGRVINPICIHEGLILDGVHRHRAVREIEAETGRSVECPATLCDGDPYEYVLAQNVRRRQMTSDQIAMAVARMTNKIKAGGDRQSKRAKSIPSDRGNASTAPIAEKHGVSLQRVERAKTLANALPEVATAVAEGTISLNDGENLRTKIKKEPPEKQAAARERASESIQTVAERKDAGELCFTTASAVYNESAKQAREDSKPDPPVGKFDLITIDAPWQSSRIPTPNKDPHAMRSLDYDCMTVDEIKALPIPDLCADDAWVMLWATNRTLPQAIEIVQSGWNLRYFETWVWRKANPQAEDTGAEAKTTGPQSAGAQQEQLRVHRGRQARQARVVRAQ